MGRGRGRGKGELLHLPGLSSEAHLADLPYNAWASGLGMDLFLQAGAERDACNAGWHGSQKGHQKQEDDDRLTGEWLPLCFVQPGVVQELCSSEAALWQVVKKGSRMSLAPWSSAAHF